MSLEVYRKKIEQNPYNTSLVVEERFVKGEIVTLPRSVRWEREWEPFKRVVEKLAGLLPDNVVGRGLAIAKILQSVSYMTGMYKNTAIAAAHAAQAVMVLTDLGVPQDSALSIVAEATGLSKGLIETALRGGGGGGGGGGRGGGGRGGGGGAQASV